ncbi:uncharacterized protein zgc:113227 isoform X3 [Brienomyrus brachyistius]|uniref:uncharacterized protein zgc:113227 isoform X3 n=1 Tax=Brienomyrus brachyistius TaxID=42636 RepID=UPI0020B37464|nr:uncharacterized protein zgc:113227 isoform X3 [Brienomyrus brachyistius]
MAERIAYLQAFVILLKLRLHSQRHYMTALYITRRRRRRLRARRMALLNRMVRRPHAVWAHPRAQLWWDTVVPDFNSEQFLQNFRMSRESFDYICRRLRSSLQKRNTNFRLAIPVEKRVGIALWKLATNSEYRSTWLMKPFADTGKLNAQQQRFNARLSSARAIVETTFGKLKGRWRCLLKRNDCHLELTKKIALSCCVLHNICEEHGDHLLEDVQLQEQDKQPPAHISTDPREAEGADVRAALCDYFNN